MVYFLLVFPPDRIVALLRDEIVALSIEAFALGVNQPKGKLRVARVGVNGVSSTSGWTAVGCSGISCNLRFA